MSNGFTVQDYGNKKVITQNSAILNVRLEIAGADIAIEDLDIDFHIVLDSSDKPDKSQITIYNLSDTTFQRIFEKMYAVDMYVWHGNDEPSLLFRGYPARPAQSQSYSGRTNTAKGFLESPVRQDIKGKFDNPTVLELVDGKIAYENSKIDKTYRTRVSSNQIINDCIEAMGVGISKISKSLPEKFYSSYKAKGKPNVILSKVVKALGGKWCIQNGLIQILSGQETSEGTFAILLDENNSEKPLPQGQEDIIIGSRFIPFVKPNQYIKVDKTTLSGVYRCDKIILEGSNSGTGAITQFVLKVPKLKKKKGRKKKKKKAETL